jgi:DNA-binding response OmpR family regulator
VLIVENETEIQEVLCSILELAECEVERAANGAIALEKLTATPESIAPDLIFLDLMMPKMSGVTFVQELRKHKRFLETPIIVVSGDMQVREQVNALGMDVFIGKPFSVNEVLDVVNALIGESSHV